MRIRLTILITLTTSWMSYAQTPDLKEYKIEGHNIVLQLERSMPRKDQEELLKKTGMEGLSLDTLWRFGSIGNWIKEGWRLGKTTTGYKIYKSITDLSGDLKWTKAIIDYSTDLATTIRSQVDATLGANNLRNNSVVTTKTGTHFFLKGKSTAKDVYLSGTFNEWSTLKTRMLKVDSGWVATVQLHPGKHQYKFIIDGHWMEDPDNKTREDDGQGGYNSVYYVTNYEFKLNGNTNAKRVVLSGSFNNWNEVDFKMLRTSTGWRLPIYLKDGTYEYKFIVDGTWIADPGNANIRDDGKGNTNSYLQLGGAVMFKLPGYANARKVILAGEFNNWNEEQLVMKKTPDGWEIPYVLAAGNYQYKFIIDGQWMTDPLNPHLASQHGHINSVVTVKPNHTFVLKKYQNALSVSVAGSFNDWGVGYSMKRTPDGWVYDAWLPPGKCLYKFIVDGKWIIDPGNEQWEQNEFGNGNSVLWIGAGEE
jgi:1,4-alpha-glucan branching enzyme